MLIKEIITELTFHGRQCTKDCSGHKAGWEWERKHQTNQPAQTPSPSFNSGTEVAISQAKAGKRPIGTNIRGAKGRFQKFQPQMEDVEVDEIIGVKKYHDMTIGDATEAIAQAMGTKVLGGGYFAQTIQSQNPNVIYKVFQKDDAYLSFAEFARTHPNKHFPKILKIKPMTSFFKRYDVQMDKFYVIAMEKLYPIRDYNEAKLYSDFLRAQNVDSIPAKLPNGDRNSRRLPVREILSRFPEFQDIWDAAQLVRKNLMNSRGIHWDLHPGNFLKRADGTIVITDPITSDEGFAYMRSIDRAREQDAPMIQGPKYLQKFAKKPENLITTITGAKKRIAQLEIEQQKGNQLDQEDSMVLSVLKRMVKHHQKAEPAKNVTNQQPDENP